MIAKACDVQRSDFSTEEFVRFQLIQRRWTLAHPGTESGLTTVTVFFSMVYNFLTWVVIIPMCRRIVWHETAIPILC